MSRVSRGPRSARRPPKPAAREGEFAHHLERQNESLRLVVADADIQRAIKLLIDQHGDEAPIHAAMRADELLDKGDLDGAAVWRRIVGAINELLSTRPSDGESVH